MRDVFDSVDQLLIAHGVTRPMQQAARDALHRRVARPDYRAKIVASLILAGGLCVVFSLAGAGLRPYLSLFIAVLLVAFFSVVDRSLAPRMGDSCHALLEHTRKHVDFHKLARDIAYFDPDIARDLQGVLAVGLANPTDLSDYSILHLWECLRASSHDRRASVEMAG